MTSPIKMLLTPDLCRLCGQDCKGDKDRLEIRGSFSCNVCSPCQQDYFLQHSETIEETLERGIRPQDAIPYRRAN
jgi:hypothetical protein